MSTLIVAAHPDDEVLGAGGWMATHPGCKVAILSEGTSSRYETLPTPDPDRDPGLQAWKGLAKQAIEAKRRDAARAAAGLHAALVFEGEYADQQLAITNQALHREVARLLREHEPVTVLTHHPHDMNADHRVVAEVVAVACRSFTAAGTRIQALLHFLVDAWAVPGTLPPQPGYNILLGLTEAQLHQKLTAIAAYQGELRPWPHPRNLDALRHHARWLGAVSGHYAAEPYLHGWGRLV
jgi:LmbE family N-acetylglucosaminyl deacetylase